ncbi:MAG TPA: ACP S-malonyltransferase [Pyrinomonadaceae bacterium]|nr:ACP S-malonyltransferase [Pyrinomonadaceae bacterium]
MDRHPKIAYVFPGQGSQFVGMGKDLAENFPVARQVFEEADAALDFPISRLCFNGTVDELELTENTQPAILTCSIAALRAIESRDLPKADYLAGHSLGEYSALVAAGALTFSEAIRIVRNRGRYMQAAVPVGMGTMAAVLGLSLREVEKACQEASEGQVCAPANINAPSQIVIAGNTEAIDRATDLLKTLGAKRTVRLNVSAPFHCALMMPAQEKLANDLARMQLRHLRVPLVTNVDAVAISTASAARESLIRQVSSPVRWLESVELLIQQGVETFVEVGPSRVLSGLIRQISREVKSYGVGDSASLAAAESALC